MRRKDIRALEKELRALARELEKANRRIAVNQEQIAANAARIAILEAQFERILEQLEGFKDYKNRTDEELISMKQALEDIEHTLGAIVNKARNESEIVRAKSLRRRARNNLTRARNELESRGRYDQNS